MDNYLTPHTEPAFTQHVDEQPDGWYQAAADTADTASLAEEVQGVLDLVKAQPTPDNPNGSGEVLSARRALTVHIFHELYNAATIPREEQGARQKVAKGIANVVNHLGDHHWGLFLRWVSLQRRARRDVPVDPHLLKCLKTFPHGTRKLPFWDGGRMTETDTLPLPSEETKDEEVKDKNASRCKVSIRDMAFEAEGVVATQELAEPTLEMEYKFQGEHRDKDREAEAATKEMELKFRGEEGNKDRETSLQKLEIEIQRKRMELEFEANNKKEDRAAAERAAERAAEERAAERALAAEERAAERAKKLEIEAEAATTLATKKLDIEAQEARDVRLHEHKLAEEAARDARQFEENERQRKHELQMLQLKLEMKN